MVVLPNEDSDISRTELTIYLSRDHSSSQNLNTILQHLKESPPAIHNIPSLLNLTTAQANIFELPNMSPSGLPVFNNPPIDYFAHAENFENFPTVNQDMFWAEQMLFTRSGMVSEVLPQNATQTHCRVAFKRCFALK